ncbi:MAG TPA: glucose-6-phosphate dehydrogenase assembly protein OpcA [Solirubrobacteraceae bacterium]|nr:glucose-6-phosphate dehydrogenase assembly protein OpcA [Solirubrobacteraceae bacterium]
MPAVDDTVWSAQSTTPAAIENALRELLAERHAESSAYVPARVLNLVCIVDREWSGEIANRLRRVGRNHASRTIVCAISPGRTTLDAVATVAADTKPTDGELALTFETIVVDVGPRHVERLDTIVDPLVVTDIPTAVWAPHGHWEAVAALRRVSQCVLLDSLDDPEVAVALRRAAQLLEDRNVVDLAWLRTTPWRERIAAMFDPPDKRPLLREVRGVTVRHHPVSGAAALLICGWLGSRLGWPAAPLRRDGAGRASGRLGEVDVLLESAAQEMPGLVGLTLTLSDGSSLALDRGPGGLHAVEVDADGIERRWRLLGASRGEGGILGEGIRQSLVGDPVYGEALRQTGGMLE